MLSKISSHDSLCNMIEATNPELNLNPKMLKAFKEAMRLVQDAITLVELPREMRNEILRQITEETKGCADPKELRAKIQETAPPLVKEALHLRLNQIQSLAFKTLEEMFANQGLSLSEREKYLTQLKS